MSLDPKDKRVALQLLDEARAKIREALKNMGHDTAELEARDHARAALGRAGEAIDKLRGTP